MILIFIAGLVVLGAAALVTMRQRDHRADRGEMGRLLATQPVTPRRFDRAMVADLPEPARRYLNFSIAEGTPLYTVAKIEMTGKLSLGNKRPPATMDMRAVQVLAAPEGFVWQMAGGSGAMRVAGSDAAEWTRFWVAGLLPVARLGGNSDHARSAFGRCVAEAVFWTPAALLSGPGVSWEGVDDNTARVTVRHNDLEQSVDVTIAADGRPTQVIFPRWSNANPDKVYRIQPFGGHLSRFREFHGFCLPTHVEAGNFFGTADYFPFFIADVTSVRFPERGTAG